MQYLIDFLKNSKINDYHLGDFFWNITLVIFVFYLYFLVLYLYKEKKLKILYYLVFFLFIIFLPNTLYLITEIRHLLNYCNHLVVYNTCPLNSWMIFFFLFYAFIGIISFYYLVKDSSQKLIKKEYRHYYIHFLIIIESLAVLIGLINRANSWHLFNQPFAIIKMASLYFLDWVYIKQYIAILLTVYFMFYSLDFLMIKKAKEWK